MAKKTTKKAKTIRLPAEKTTNREDAAGTVKRQGKLAALSISLPTPMAVELRAICSQLVPGLELNLSDAARYVIGLGLAAHKAKATLAGVEETVGGDK